MIDSLGWKRKDFLCSFCEFFRKRKVGQQEEEEERPEISEKERGR